MYLEGAQYVLAVVCWPRCVGAIARARTSRRKIGYCEEDCIGVSPVTKRSCVRAAARVAEHAVRRSHCASLFALAGGGNDVQGVDGVAILVRCRRVWAHVRTVLPAVRGRDDVDGAFIAAKVHRCAFAHAFFDGLRSAGAAPDLHHADRVAKPDHAAIGVSNAAQ